MKLNLKNTRIIAIFGVFIFSFLSHFAYALLPNILFSFFFPVNESIWEHMKILVTSSLIYSVIDYMILKKKNINFNNYPFQLWFTALLIVPLYLSIYIPLYKLLGENTFISITLLFIIYIIKEVISYNILKAPKLKIVNSLIIPILISIYLLFIYLTYNPPHKFIFYNPLNKTYGIEKNID